MVKKKYHSTTGQVNCKKHSLETKIYVSNFYRKQETYRSTLSCSWAESSAGVYRMRAPSSHGSWRGCLTPCLLTPRTLLRHEPVTKNIFCLFYFWHEDFWAKFVKIVNQFLYIFNTLSLNSIFQSCNEIYKSRKSTLYYSQNLNFRHHLRHHDSKEGLQRDGMLSSLQEQNFHQFSTYILFCTIKLLNVPLLCSWNNRGSI